MEKDPIKTLSPSLSHAQNHSFEVITVTTVFARKNLRYALTVISTILFFFACSIAVATQTPEPTTADSPDVKTDLSNVKDFRPLFEERERLIGQISKLDRDIDNLQSEVLTLKPISVLKKKIAVIVGSGFSAALTSGSAPVLGSKPLPTLAGLTEALLTHTEEIKDSKLIDQFGKDVVEGSILALKKNAARSKLEQYDFEEFLSLPAAALALLLSPACRS